MRDLQPLFDFYGLRSSNVQSMKVCAQVKRNWAVVYVTQNFCFSAVQRLLFTVINPGQLVRSSMMSIGHAIRKSVHV